MFFGYGGVPIPIWEEPVMARRAAPDPGPVEQLIVEQARLLARQLEQAAAAAPDGQVLARAEGLAVTASRGLIRRSTAGRCAPGSARARRRPGRSGPPPARWSCRPMARR